MTEQIERRSKRILVAMDACRQNRETLERALALAESMQAELIHIASRTLSCWPWSSSPRSSGLNMRA